MLVVGLASHEQAFCLSPSPVASDEAMVQVRPDEFMERYDGSPTVLLGEGGGWGKGGMMFGISWRKLEGKLPERGNAEVKHADYDWTVDIVRTNA